MNETIQKQYIDIFEASIYASIPVATLRLFRAQNRPPESYKIAGRVMYDIDKLKKWIEDEKADSTRGSYISTRI
jgi:hypothetical protein